MLSFVLLCGFANILNHKASQSLHEGSQRKGVANLLLLRHPQKMNFQRQNIEQINETFSPFYNFFENYDDCPGQIKVVHFLSGDYV